jgi:hypothetical protein
LFLAACCYADATVAASVAAAFFAASVAVLTAIVPGCMLLPQMPLLLLPLLTAITAGCVC